jgi:CP family cyanate transporter-like MFS transporter
VSRSVATGGAARPDRLILALFICALTLREPIAGITPLFPTIERHLHSSHAAVGLLVTIPVVCMGLVAPLTPRLAGRHGARATILGCLIVLGLVGVVRAVAPSIVWLVAFTVPLGLAIGLASAAQPVVVRENRAARPGRATAVYSAGIQVGAALTATFAAPLEGLGGGWRTSLLVYSLACLAIAAAWRAFAGRDVARPPAPRRMGPRPPLPRAAWLLAAGFALQGILYNGLSAWLPALYEERGWTASAGGALLGVLNVASLLTSVALSLTIDRRGSRRTYLVGSTLLVAVALLAFISGTALAVPGAILAGIGLSGLFVAMLLLPLDVATTPAQVAPIAARMLGIGFVVSGLAPEAIGAIRDVTGSYVPALWSMVAIAAALLAVSTRMRSSTPRPSSP